MQQTPIGGFLVSTSTIHKESITQILSAYPYIFTYSISKVNVYLIDQDQDAFSHLFQVKLPSAKKLNTFLSMKNKNNKYEVSDNDLFIDNKLELNLIKCIIKSDDFMNNTISSLETNPGNFEFN